MLLLLGLEASVTELRRGIDPFEVDLFGGPSRGLWVHGLAESQDTLLDTWTRSLDHDPVVLNLTISDESTQWCNSLLGKIELSSSVSSIITLANSVHLVITRGTMMVTILTGTSNSPLDVRRMPGTNTGNLTETLVCLSGQLLGSPSRSNTRETMTLGDTDNINHLVLLEDGVDWNWLLEETLSEVDLVGDRTTVDLDFHEVGLLLLEWCLADLGVGENTDDSAVLLDTLELVGNGGTVVVGVLLGVLGESLLLGSVPILVESALDFVAEMLSPNGGEGAETAGGFDVTDDTDSNHWWGFNDCDGLDNLTLVHLSTWTVQITNNRGHSGLVTEGSSQMDWLLLVIDWEGLDLSSVSGGTLAWEEGQRAVTWGFVFSL